MMTALTLRAMGIALPNYDPDYEYNLAWLFDDEPSLAPHNAVFPTLKDAFEKLLELASTGNAFNFVSISKRTASQGNLLRGEDSIIIG